MGSIADMTVFSFHPVKHITTGEGGMVATERCQLRRDAATFSQPRNLERRAAAASAGQWHYEMVLLGFNYRLPDFACAWEFSS